MNNQTIIFDTQLYLKRQQKHLSSSTYSQQSFLYEAACSSLANRLQDITKSFSHILNISPRNGEIKNQVAKLAHCQSATFDEKSYISHGSRGHFADNFKKEYYDLILSCFDIHWLNDIPSFFLQIRQLLADDGAFLTAFLGNNTLSELRYCFYEAEKKLGIAHTPHISPMINLQSAAGLLQSFGFALPVVDKETITVKYKNAYELMKDLRSMGENNCWLSRKKSFSSRALFELVNTLYQKTFSDIDGYITASFDIVFMIGWKPHKSQPKPLRPGSADVSLKDILESKGKPQ